MFVVIAAAVALGIVVGGIALLAFLEIPGLFVLCLVVGEMLLALVLVFIAARSRSLPTLGLALLVMAPGTIYAVWREHKGMNQVDKDP
jgi:hypothetical protein